MINRNIKKIIILTSISVSLLLLTNPVMSFATSKVKPFVLNNNSITYNENKKNILIYHSHTLEDYTNTDIVKIGEDLSNKLIKQGYNVIHIKDNFSVDYNSAYDKSRTFLEGIDFSNIDLAIDLHRDALNTTNTEVVDGKDVAKIMMVYSQNSGNYDNVKKIGATIGKPLNKLGILRQDWEYENGVNYFNQDMFDKLLLIEVGNNSNDKWSLMRANTYLSKSIDSYLEGK